MNSRNSLDRVLTTVNHKEPDRVPVGEWGIDHDHVSRILGRHTYWRNRKDSTIALWENRRDEMVGSMKHDYAELIEKLDYDIIPVELVPPQDHTCPDPPKKIDERLWRDSQGNIFKYAASNDSIMCMTPSAAKDDFTREDLEEAVNNLPNYDNGEFELVDHICEKFGKSRAIVFRGINIDDRAFSVFGGDASHTLMITALNPEAVKRALKYAVEYNKNLINHCAKRNITVIMTGRDYGNSTGCIENPDSIRRLYMPSHKIFVSYVQKMGKIPFLHCCGNVWDIMDDLVNAGYRAYQSVQASAGMNWAKLKEKYGEKLTLWAGVQCETLITGSARDVENEVRNALDVLMPGGGFIFGSTNSVQYGANTDNYLRVLELVRKYGVY